MLAGRGSIIIERTRVKMAVPTLKTCIFLKQDHQENKKISSANRECRYSVGDFVAATQDDQFSKLHHTTRSANDRIQYDVYFHSNSQNSSQLCAYLRFRCPLRFDCDNDPFQYAFSPMITNSFKYINTLGFLFCAVAGVIGKRKFSYDLWGDSVNTAARMESHGIEGEIQVTESTFGLLENEYDFDCRGMIEVKGKGMMKTFY